MPQLAHVDVGDTPVDLTDGLAAGCYLAQARGGWGALALLYATAAQPPADDDDWFRARGDTFFAFSVSTASGLPTWAKNAVAGTAPTAVALART